MFIFFFLYFISTIIYKFWLKIKLFDIYQGAQIPEGKKSVAYSVWLRSADSTLTDKEIDDLIFKKTELFNMRQTIDTSKEKDRYKAVGKEIKAMEKQIEELQKKKAGLKRRQRRVRAKIFGTAERPRLSVHRTNSHIYAQVIDDVAGNTLVAASSLDKAIEGNGGNKAAARAVGKLVAERAKAKGIEEVVFDRGGYVYHGRVQALADAAREGGLKF